MLIFIILSDYLSLMIVLTWSHYFKYS